MSIDITFIDTTQSVPEEFFPIPASGSLPDWYRNLPPYHHASGATIGINHHKGDATGKRCLPMFDALTSGYLIRSVTDLYISDNLEGHKFYQWASEHGDRIEFHPRVQMSTFSIPETYQAIPKFVNPWSIVTPPGYSVLCIPPVNRDDVPVEIFSGIIDTDKFHVAGNFPFLLTDSSFTGMIPAGTPIAQVIPFKRDSFEMRIGDEADLEKSRKSRNLLFSLMLNGYRKFFWSRKEYR